MHTQHSSLLDMLGRKWGNRNRRVNLGGVWSSHNRRCQRSTWLTQLGHNDIGHVRVEMYFALSNNESGS